MTPEQPAATPRKPISLALQGGGAHSAFEWGVIDRLADDGRLEIKAITAASGGSMNAVVTASAMLDGGGAAEVRERLEAFWRSVSHASPFAGLGPWSEIFTPGWLKATPGWLAAQNLAGAISPYQFNPLNLNPVRQLLNDQVDFAALRERSPVRLYVSATAVRTGRSKVFRAPELTAEHILASACLPHLFQAVEIDGEPYWDGGYLANPALWPMFYDPTPDDILIVNLNPFVRKTTPRLPGEIVDRLNEISFNAPLTAELRAVAFVAKLIDEGMLTAKARKSYRRLCIHTIGADRWLEDLHADSKFDTDWSFLVELRDRGRRAADAWLKDGLADVGVRSSCDLADYLGPG